MTRFDYKVTLKDAGGQPLAGKDVVLAVDGDGSLQQGFNAKQIVRETNANGEIAFSWFRRSIFGRDVKATVSAEPKDLPDALITLEPTELQKVETSYRTKTWPLRIGGRNIYR
jgi:hypothetical protein